jgi:hypothetical protein
VKGHESQAAVWLNLFLSSRTCQQPSFSPTWDRTTHKFFRPLTERKKSVEPARSLLLRVQNRRTYQRGAEEKWLQGPQTHHGQSSTLPTGDPSPTCHHDVMLAGQPPHLQYPTHLLSLRSLFLNQRIRGLMLLRSAAQPGVQKDNSIIPQRQFKMERSDSHPPNPQRTDQFQHHLVYE